MVDEHVVDEHLVAVLNEVLDAVYQAKQAAWSATDAATTAMLQDLVRFLIDQSGQFMVAEERIDGRSAAVSSPSSHQRGNLLAEADGDVATAIGLLADRLERIIEDVRARATEIPRVKEAQLLADLADGLEARVQNLRPSQQ
jgi:hypothetical protein